MRLLFVIILISIYSFGFSQKPNKETIVTGIIIVGEDTMPHFELKEVIVVPEYKFTSEKQKRRYSRLVINVKKVYPYAQMANAKLKDIEKKVDSLGTKSIAKKYIKQVDQELRDQYGDELKKLTITQGRILIKLIDRETGSTSYELVKELRGTFSAFMWQSLARLFGENLKEEYNPQEEDRMIEHIILMIENGQL
ncbi:MAG: DUF4294 domain-containing protein [Bacteroidales bacterium]|nr:DUF4294 domain-containing protein [Bacteroidales bacterium]